VRQSCGKLAYPGPGLYVGKLEQRLNKINNNGAAGKKAYMVFGNGG